MLSPKTIFLILIFIGVILEVIGDVILKYWANTNKTNLLIIGFSFYIIGSIFWIISLKYEYLSRAIIVFATLNAITLVIAGSLIFNEHLSIQNKLGVALALLSIFMLEW